MDQETKKPKSNLNLNLDNTPVLYTDIILWNINPDGIVLNFGHYIMGTSNIKIHSRIGMSREHAKKFVDLFGKDIALTEAQGQSGKGKN